MSSKDYIQLDDGVYEQVPRHAQAASTIIADMHTKLGKPETPLSKTGEKMMGIIISVWEDMYGGDVQDWMKQRKEYRENEMDVKEQVKKETGGSLASLPSPIYQMMRKVFPKYKLSTRDDWIKFLQRYPMFAMSKHRQPKQRSSNIIV